MSDAVHLLHVQWHPGKWEEVHVRGAASVEDAIAWYRKEYGPTPKVQAYSEQIAREQVNTWTRRTVAERIANAKKAKRVGKQGERRRKPKV